MLVTGSSVLRGALGSLTAGMRGCYPAGNNPGIRGFGDRRRSAETPGICRGSGILRSHTPTRSRDRVSLSVTDVKSMIAQGREQPGVEFKGAGALSDRQFRARVVRAVLAMSNRRDGGTVIVGVMETNGLPSLEGLTAHQRAQWSHDHLGDAIAPYADPRVVFDAYELELDEKVVIIIEVAEFPDVPVICKKTYQTQHNVVILREGALYVRSHRKPESTEVANAAEMRDLLEIAIDKETRRFLSRAHSAGLESSRALHMDHTAAFAAERGDL